MSIFASGRKVLQGLTRFSRGATAPSGSPSASPGDAPTRAVLSLPGQPVAPTSSLPGPAVDPPSLDLQVGPYQLRRLLGEGGMGRVYEAFDPSLQRLVAVKLLRIASEEAKARILLEARSQAKVEHPHICKIFEVGHHDGQPFIVMQRIQGTSLDLGSGGYSVEQKVLLIKQAAEALHAAHQVGLIHRDLKPANIMVEQTPEGVLVPYVLDFGLARDVDSQGLTLTGQVMGTPAYMAPEQAEGRALDRRSDVYGLGATLYWLCSGQAPFEGENLAGVLTRVLLEDAASLAVRAPQVPQDLNTIVMKCLQKAPSARYDSARALAEDLGRYLAGDPIWAKPTTTLERWGRALRKHPVVSLSLAASLTLALGSGGFGGWTYWRSRKRTELAQQLGREAERLESLLRFAHLMPLHDLGPDLARVETRKRELEAELPRIGAWGQGPIQFTLGRLQLAQGHPEQALAHFRAAERSGYRSPDLALSLGKALALRYQELRMEADAIRNPGAREARLQLLARELKSPALQYLGQGQGAFSETLPLVRGLMASVEGNGEEALRQWASAARLQPWNYEILLLAAQVLLERSGQCLVHGDPAGCQGALAAMDPYLRAATELGRSDPAVFTLRAMRELQSLSLAKLAGEPLEPHRERILATTALALQADPGHAKAWIARARLFRVLAEFENLQQRDPTSIVNQVLDAADRASARDPKEGQAPFCKLSALLWQGDYLQSHGQDPRPTLERAFQEGQKAVTLRPWDIAVWNDRTVAYQILAEYEASHGLDPGPTLREGIRTLREGLALQPGYALFHINLATLLSQLGRTQALRIDEAVATHEEAVREALQGTQLNPKHAIGWNNLGTARMMEAEARDLRGEDPRPLLEAAIQAYEESHRLNPAYLPALTNIAQAALDIAQALDWAGADPTEALARTRARLKVRLEAGTASPVTLNILAEEALARADWALEQRRIPSPALEEARRHLQASQALDPHGEPLEFLQFRFRLLKGRARRDRRGLETLWSALDGAPASPESRRTTARLRVLTAEALLELGSTERSQAGLQAAEELQKHFPREPLGWYLAARLLHRLPDRREQARPAMEHAVSLDPRLRARLDGGRY